MTDYNITKARNFPMNRDGEELQYAGHEGDLVGLSTDDNSNPILVKADAASDVQQQAVGVLMEEVNDPTKINVNGFEYADIEQRQLRREVTTGEYTLLGDEGTYIFDGIMLTNVDHDDPLDVGEPVWLDVGGGFTQMKPSSAGEVVQRVGLAVDTDTLLLDVDIDYAMA